MSKKESEAIVGGSVAIVLVLSHVLGVSIAALGNFIWPFGLLITIFIGFILYLWKDNFTTFGVTGILLLWVGALWFNSFGLWQSYGYDGKDFDLGSFIVPMNQSGGFHPEPVVVHPFVFEQAFLVLWYVIGLIIVGTGAFLAYDGWERYGW